MTELLSGTERYQFIEKSDITVSVNWTNTNNYTNTTSGISRYLLSTAVGSKILL